MSVDLKEVQKSFLEELMEIDEIVGRLPNSNVKIELQEKLYNSMMTIKKDQIIDELDKETNCMTD